MSHNSQEGLSVSDCFKRELAFFKERVEFYEERYRSIIVWGELSNDDKHEFIKTYSSVKPPVREGKIAMWFNQNTSHIYCFKAYVIDQSNSTLHSLFEEQCTNVYNPFDHSGIEQIIKSFFNHLA